MKTKRSKKRYNTINQIMEDIDRQKARYEKLMEEATQRDIHAQELLQKDALFFEESAYEKEQAKKLRGKAARIMEVRLTHLKHKLSELMTPQLPGVDNGDSSIQA